MDAHELARWTRFAAKGGIGKCTAIVDCIAQEMGEDLMFLKDDEITVLMQLPEPGIYLGHCEGVVGRFSGKDVRFHGKLKKPVMAKKGSVTASGSESRTSISLAEGSGSRAEFPAEVSRHTSESPSSSRPASRAKRTPSPSHSKSHAHMQSYSSSYSQYDPSATVISDSRSTTIVGIAQASTAKDARFSSTKSSHAKPPEMATSISGASIFSAGSASVYSEASTATSATSGRTRSRNGSIYTINSDETEKDIPEEHGNGTGNQANGDQSDPRKLASASVPMPDTILPTTPSVSALASNTMVSASTSTPTLISTSTSPSGTSIPSTSPSVTASFGSVGSISELETKQFDMGTFGTAPETPTGFVLVPPPLGIGNARNSTTSVAPLRVSKSPRLPPSPVFPPSSPLSVPLATSGESPRSPASPSPLSPGIPGSLTSRPPTSPPLGIPGSLSPGLPSSLAPGQRSPGLLGSLLPGFRSSGFPHGSNAASQYMFPPGSGSNSPNPYAPAPSPYAALSNPHADLNPNPNDSNQPASPNVRTPPPTASPYGVGPSSDTPLSPPPSSPLPPLPATLPSPAFFATALPAPGVLPTMGTAATAAASGRTSPLEVLSSSLPSSASGTMYVDDQHGWRDGDRIQNGRQNGDAWDEAEEGNTTRLSTLDAFRRRLDDSADEMDGEQMGGRSEDEGGRVRCSRGGKEDRGTRVSEDEKEREAEEDAHSDGEVGIGLSLMGALGREEDEDDAYEDDAQQVRKTEGDGQPSTGDISASVNEDASNIENGGAASMAWTRYSPTSPISVQEPNGHHRAGEEEEGEGESEEEYGGYWDDIYDDYRYSRYSLASKRFSIASRHGSILSKASGGSKASSRTRANAPPIPVPLDRPSLDAQPSIGSDGTNGYPRPSFESTSSSVSSPMQFARPSMIRPASNDSTYGRNMLPLTAQFPAVPMHVPVRTESRLRIVHDGYMHGDDHGGREQHVMHESTELEAGQVGLNIEVVAAAQEDGGQGQEVEVDRQLTLLSVNTGLSPLLHTTFGSPHSSRFTDFEDGSDQDHGRRYSSKSGKSAMSSSVEGPPKSPIEGGGIASVLRARMEATSVPSPSATAPATDAPSTEEPGVRAIVVDDEEVHNITSNGPTPATEVVSPLPTSSTQSSNGTQATVPADPPKPTPPAEQPEGKSPFLRPRPQPSKSPHPFARTSMFLPHPNAPKAVHQSQGPMYGRTASQPYSYPAVPSGPNAGKTVVPPTPPGTTFYSTHILHQLRNLSIAVSQGQARRSPMTLFARCQPDLSASMGPVPILFSLDPFPPLPTGPLMKAGGGMGAAYPVGVIPTRAATVSAPVRRGVVDDVPPDTPSTPSVRDASPSPLRLPKRLTTAATNVGPPGLDGGPLSSPLPIPREGFVPQVGAARPRSRSFSAFSAHVPASWSQEKSSEVHGTKVQDARSASPSPSVNMPPRETSLPPALMARHAPSPLVLHNSNRDRNACSPAAQSPSLSAQIQAPPSPFTQEHLMYSPQFIDATQVANTNEPLANPIMSPPFASDSDREKDAPPAFGPGSGPTPSGVTGRTSVSSSDPRGAPSPLAWMPGQQDSLDAPHRNSSMDGLPRKSSDSSDSHPLVSPPPISDAVSQSARSSPLAQAQEHTLRTKLSLPALRIKASIRSKMDDTASVASFGRSEENETVQVQDMDFELVKPSIPQVVGRASQESTLTSRDADTGKADTSPIVGDAASMISAAPKSPLVPQAPPTESAESIDAHRQRELKWMALFPAVPPSQARKNKKVRKLLQEGVPSSVRYLVWCHLTDSKARALPGVYAKLGNRPPVPAFAEIENDAAEGFPDQPQLHTAQGPVVSLLQAYLSMVPDIQYDSGLTFIAGHLLLLAPEEDAFWIFASMMDAHLRSYFATNSVHVEIDASLFSKALEAIDPMLTKKLYVQLSISPASITRPWFSTLFVGSLSVDLLHRVWDIFLYDGIPYLFRVGLVVVNCVRHLLLQANTEEAVLAHLAHPPPACLPSATELLVLAANVKLKDDDVRKQRIKMEQQLKKTTLVRPPNGVSHLQTATISLPKT